MNTIGLNECNPISKQKGKNTLIPNNNEEAATVYFSATGRIEQWWTKLQEGKEGRFSIKYNRREEQSELEAMEAATNS